MFHIINAKTLEAVADCETKQQVLCAKDGCYFCFIDRETGELDFSELNVTGSDIAPCSQYKSLKNECGLYERVQVANAPTRLKRYVVLDDGGRHVDPRTWGACEYAQLYAQLVAYPHGRNVIAPDDTRPERVSGPAMWHRSMMELSAASTDEFGVGVSAMPRSRGITKRRCDTVNERECVERALKPKTDRTEKQQRLTARRRRQAANKWLAVEADWGSGVIADALFEGIDILEDAS